MRWCRCCIFCVNVNRNMFVYKTFTLKVIDCRLIYKFMVACCALRIFQKNQPFAFNNLTSISSFICGSE